jgi:hypothetical protein
VVCSVSIKKKHAAGRVFWGHLCDVFGYKMCMTLVTVCISVLYSTLYFTEYGGKVFQSLLLAITVEIKAGEYFAPRTKSFVT